MTSSEPCESLAHEAKPVPAQHLVVINAGTPGYRVCDQCLLSYIDSHIQLAHSFHVPFEVRSL
jgi:hypothetical protein